MRVISLVKMWLAMVVFYVTEAMAQYELQPVPDNAIFGEGSKPVQIMTSGQWAVIGFAGIAAVAFGVAAANYAIRNEWSKCLGGLVGVAIAAGAAWIVADVQGTSTTP